MPGAVGVGVNHGIMVLFLVGYCCPRRRIVAVKIMLRERESIQEAVRRFRKIVERSGLKREARSRAYYEKPSEVKR